MQVSSKFWGSIGFDISAVNSAVLRNIEQFRLAAEKSKKRPEKKHTADQALKEPSRAVSAAAGRQDPGPPNANDQPALAAAAATLGGAPVAGV